jgi:predicted methyltransferase
MLKNITKIKRKNNAVISIGNGNKIEFRFLYNLISANFMEIIKRRPEASLEDG